MARFYYEDHLFVNIIYTLGIGGVEARLETSARTRILTRDTIRLSSVGF